MHGGCATLQVTVKGVTSSLLAPGQDKGCVVERCPAWRTLRHSTGDHMVASVDAVSQLADHPFVQRHISDVQ